MYDFAKLCKRIAMPGEVTELLLTGPKTDAGGFLTLHAHLEAACAAWERYQELGISEEIYIATMAAFSRFVREHRESFGVYGFDRGFWTTRQTGCVLFRIGELEYELLEENHKRYISLHIPSDADLSLPELLRSRNRARQLIDTRFPAYRDAAWVCHSWLLSPELPRLLPESSRILGFQRGFAVVQAEDDGEFKQWVYGRPDIPDAALPEDTTLQRRLKEYLLAGNSFHAGRGILREDAFQPQVG